jgi:hypothetical protein
VLDAVGLSHQRYRYPGLWQCASECLQVSRLYARGGAVPEHDRRPLRAEGREPVETSLAYRRPDVLLIHGQSWLSP